MASMIDILHAEHEALATLLHAATGLLANSREQERRPDFEALRAMLFYVAEFPERHHHRKESTLLFPKLRARAPTARGMLDHLDEDHRRGDARIRDLEHELTAFEMLGEARRAAFETALKSYVEFYRTHMAMEEKEIFPLARRVLQASDWEQLDAEFAKDSDPLTGGTPEIEYASLLNRLGPYLPSLLPRKAV